MDLAVPVKSRLSHRSPGITAIYNELKGSTRNRVLDLGSSSGPSFNFFSKLSCNIHFESVDGLLAERIRSPALSETPQQCLEDYLSQFSQDQKFDVILTWDIFNYLDLDSIRWLMTKLNQYCHPETLLHSVKYVGANIPAVPRQFQIVDQYHLSADNCDLVPRRLPSHSTAQLLKLMPDFDLQHSYLNYRGMVPGLAEYVLCYGPGRDKRARRQVSDELASEQTLYHQIIKSHRLDHTSYALSAAHSKIPCLKTSKVLDLSLKNKHNHEYWLPLVDSLYTEDLYSHLGKKASASAPQTLKSHVLNFDKDVKFDLILAWDLLNHLSPWQIQHVFERLRKHTSSGTQLHVILYSGREIPARPQRFDIVGADKLSIEPVPKQPHLTPLTLSSTLKALQYFVLADTFVYREGMQRGVYEYLFQIP